MHAGRRNYVNLTLGLLCVVSPTHSLTVQYGVCTACPTVQKGVSIAAAMAEPAFLVVVFGVLFMIRSMAPRGLMKVGISMLQIVGNANEVYSIPWPVQFSNFLDVVKVSLSTSSPSPRPIAHDQ